MSQNNTWNLGDAFLGILAFFGGIISFLVHNVGFVLLVVLVILIYRAMKNSPKPKPVEDDEDVIVLTEEEKRKIYADRIRARRRNNQ